MFIMKIFRLNDLSFGAMIQFSIIGTMIYFIISNNQTYKLTSNLLGIAINSDNIANNNGCPTMIGTLLHTFTFFIIVFLSMILF